jgi:hypothetical protein
VGIALSYEGSRPDIGALEYGGPPPTSVTEQAIYTFDSNGIDSDDDGTHYDLAEVSTADHSSTTGITIDNAADGYYQGTIFDS